MRGKVRETEEMIERELQMLKIKTSKFGHLIVCNS